MYIARVHPLGVKHLSDITGEIPGIALSHRKCLDLVQTGGITL